MDRRSWLWRRKSSEKSPSGETESSGSASSHSERFSDDQNHSTQSPEVTSKASAGDELSDDVKILSKKLSEALLNIRAKEDLVKQHAKVAEEAVSGWERAENEVLVLKKQNESLTQKNLILEERVSHLDGALKECLRELRQAREEQQDKIFEAISKKSSQWESKKSELENQLLELQTQLENTKINVANPPTLSVTQSKLEASEKENSILKLKLISKIQELELTRNERDLSTQAAETASKQLLDSIKKVGKLEAECRKLKAGARKASSLYVESCTDSVEGERCKLESVDSEIMGRFMHERILGKNLMAPSVEIDLMDDFLEMERIAALPEIPQAGGRETRLQDELNIMIGRTKELEDNLRKVTAEKERLGSAFSCEEARLQDELEVMISRANELEEKLRKVTVEKDSLVSAFSSGEAHLRDELKVMIGQVNELEESLRKVTVEKDSLESAFNSGEARLQELKVMIDRVNKLEENLRKVTVEKDSLESAFSSGEARLQDELKVMIDRVNESEENLRKVTVEKESLEIAYNKCQIQFKASQDELEKTEMKLVDLKMQLALANEEKREVEKELESMKMKFKDLSEGLHAAEANLVEIQDELTEANETKSVFQAQLKDSNLKKAEAESQLKVMEQELETLQSSILILERQIEKERNFSEETIAKSKQLEAEIWRMKSDSQFRRSAMVEEFRINQDKELAVAASKFAECQKTIASLNQQLKSLATFDDFLIESEIS